MDDDTEDKKHPSYGMIGFNRTMNSRNNKLFGSALDEHYSTVRVTIQRAKLRHEHSRDWYFGTGEELVEVEMSSAQFAEAITSMNRGDGVPCTIRYVAGVRADDPPAWQTESDRIRAGFDDSLKAYIAKARKHRRDIEAKLSKLSAKARDEIRIALDCMEQQLAANVPFIVRQFNEATEQMVSAAKQEVEAFALHTLGNRPVDHMLAQLESVPDALPDVEITQDLVDALLADEDGEVYEGSFCEAADNEGARIAAADRGDDS